jgi:hypothetical protein
MPLQSSILKLSKLREDYVRTFSALSNRFKMQYSSAGTDQFFPFAFLGLAATNNRR